ncbi:CaiB/BaiF CoA transferase family protein [Variovorax boronicumulans]|uniref:CaiB/BaiF CoA transferase family protein n=1 Tax=Variovorax boronicumulans TaxID=436515 RepID=UPI00085C8ED3|nr:CaiB/BaiF CoA-transferase family protein [Variovorax boronicumulans]OEZ29195.1 alpha-methylacyl-CoA racemase [Variovorax boronicumulans]
MSASGPLAGVTVLDFSELLPGPFFTQNLAEMGARVIKIERPPGGDNARRMGPGGFEAVNRGKLSLLADLKDEAQRARVRELVAQADVLVESYRPGVMARLGLDYASLRESFPRLVYVSLSGYGQEGPWAQLPGHDINYLAAAGALAISGEPDGPPTQNFGLPVADLCGSMYALSSTLAALLQRERTGRGQHLDVALADCVLHWMNPRLGAYRADGASSLERQRAVAQVKPAYGSFRCRDAQYLSVAALEDHFWTRLCSVLDMGDFAGEPYRTLGARKKQAQAINDRIAQQLAERDSAEAFETMARNDLPVAPVVAPGDLATLPQFAQRDLVNGTEALSLVRFPVPLAGVDPSALADAPSLNNARQLLP